MVLTQGDLHAGPVRISRNESPVVKQPFDGSCFYKQQLHNVFFLTTINRGQLCVLPDCALLIKPPCSLPHEPTPHSPNQLELRLEYLT